jgi:hypothetical protein
MPDPVRAVADSYGVHRQAVFGQIARSRGRVPDPQDDARAPTGKIRRAGRQRIPGSAPLLVGNPVGENFSVERLRIDL